MSWLVSAGRWARWRSVALDYVRGTDVLEIGFGTGELLREMAAQGWNVAGVDASAAMHRVAGRKLRGIDRKPPVVRALAQALPLADACRDTVVSTFPAPYVVDPATLREVARVLRPGGRFVVLGLVIYSERRGEGLQFALHLPEEPAVEHFCAVAEAAGLAVRRISRHDPPSRLPVLVAERPI